MLEPVGAKQWAWHMGENMSCPTEEYPYIFTKNNSPKAVEEFKRRAAARVAASTAKPVTVYSSTQQPVTVTSDSITTTQETPRTTEKKHHHHHRKDYNKMHLAAYGAFFFLLIILLIVGICKRQQIRVYLPGGGRQRLDGFTNPQYPDDSDLEIWNRTNAKHDYSLNNDIPKTHGTRISFE